MPPLPHTVRPADFARTLDHLVDYLEYQRTNGERSADLEPETLAALAAPAPAPRSRAAAAASSSTGESLRDIERDIEACTLCPLHTTRTRTVPGQGHPRAELMFIGEGPGYAEDRSGQAFVGPAGQLLTRLITRMGFTRDEVFIANIVKCRPTEDGAGQRDRKPDATEMSTCLPYLRRQIALIRPRVIVALGGTAVEGLLGLTGISKLRGRWHEYEGIPLMPTFHPSYLLRGGGDEKQRYWLVWEDMLQVLQKLGRPAPDHRKT
ncbi:MAG: uracil-DNA glycosylase [Kiritimatiellae bacterium]|nr:uracil-DNA glycosylase [Kiritimatiellia bacterium]